MTTLKGLIGRHPMSVSIYFALTFAISWGGVLLVIGGPGGIPGTMAHNDPLFPLVLLAMLAGPSIAGVVLTALVHGKAGLREFVARLVKWRVDARWYAIALLTAPILSIVVLFILSRLSPEFVPRIAVTDDKTMFVLFAVAVALGTGFLEELGWTGFAIPELRTRYSVLTTGVIVGLLWSAWHWLVVLWGIGDRAGTVPLAVFVLVDTLTFLVAFRVLMVWVYEHTGSLLVAMLMHASATACTLIFWPVTTGISLLMFDIMIAAALWVVIAAMPLANIIAAYRTSRHPGEQS